MACVEENGKRSRSRTKNAWVGLDCILRANCALCSIYEVRRELAATWNRHGTPDSRLLEALFSGMEVID